MWLVNELILTFLVPMKYDKVQFNPIILSRVIEYTTYTEKPKFTIFAKLRFNLGINVS